MSKFKPSVLEEVNRRLVRENEALKIQFRRISVVLAASIEQLGPEKAQTSTGHRPCFVLDKEVVDRIEPTGIIQIETSGSHVLVYYRENG